jgi:thiol-disulfide isomerase/thioredoxin
MYVAFVFLLSALLCADRSSAVVVNLADGNFTTYLEKLPETSNLVIEFYANWCPHCRHFAPTYEQVGDFFAEQPDHPVTIARVDCALEVGTPHTQINSWNLNVFMTRVLSDTLSKAVVRVRTPFAARGHPVTSYSVWTQAVMPSEKSGFIVSSFFS